MIWATYKNDLDLSKFILLNLRDPHIRLEQLSHRDSYCSSLEYVQEYENFKMFKFFYENVSAIKNHLSNMRWTNRFIEIMTIY